VFAIHPHDATKKFYKQDLVSYDEVIKLQDKGVTLIDVRTPGEWRQTGVIPGSKKIMSFDTKGELNLIRFENELSQLGLSKDDNIVLICRSGNRTVILANELAKKGYKNISNIKFGINGWLREGRPTSK